MKDIKRKIIAIVRPPSDDFAFALTRDRQKRVVDIEKALEQHTQFCDILTNLGVIVHRLPSIRYPDSTFIEDNAIIVEGKVLLCKSKEVSRRGEEENLMDILDMLRGKNIIKNIQRIIDRGHIDGGDVVITENKIFIGISNRTNYESFKQLKNMYNNHKCYPIEMPRNVLHLKNCCTYLGNGNMLINKNLLRERVFEDYDTIEVDVSEGRAANCIGINKTVMVSKGNPKTADKIQKRGFSVIEVDISEFEKRDGALTCLVLFVT